MSEETTTKTIHEVISHHLKPAQGEEQPRFVSLNEIEVLIESALPSAAPILVAKLQEAGIALDVEKAPKILADVLGISS